MAVPAPAPLAACNVRVTRTPLAGGADVVYTESRVAPLRRIRKCSATLTQSIGDQNGVLELDNVGGYFSAWSSGDVLRIEVQRPQDAAYSLLLEGFVGEPVEWPGARPLLSVPVVGLNSVLDLIVLEDEVAYDDTAYTDMFDDLCTTYLTGYTRTITADAATGSMTFRAGMKLREALDLIRRALVAATSPAKWEWVASKDGATKEIKLFKRSAASQATIYYAEALAGTHRSRGSAYHVINKAKVLGATVPSRVVDKTGETAIGAVVLDSTNDWAAQPFEALDTPLYSHTVYGDRSSGKDPPSLAGSVARNSDNSDRFTYSFTNRRGSGAGILRYRSTNFTGSLAGLDDRVAATGATWQFTGQTDLELVVWDLGAGGAKRLGAAYINMTASGIGCTVKIWGSNDDSAWTALTADTAVAANLFPAVIGAPAGPYRYYKLTATAAGAVSPTVNDMGLFEHNNLASGVSNEKFMRMTDDTGNNTASITTGGFGTTTEFVRIDMQAAAPIIKVVAKHSETAHADITLRLQKSDNGTDWEDLGVVASTASAVIDNLYLEGGDFRYFRWVVVDQRSSGAGFAAQMDYFLFYEQTPYWSEPLAGDALRGSAWTWDVSSMVAHPSTMEETTWPAPRLALTTGRKYWFLYKPQSGASSTSFWSIDYASDPEGTEYVANGGFDYYPTTPGVPTDWTNSGTIAASAHVREATLFHSGTYAVKITGTGAATINLTQEMSGLEVGAEHVTECMARVGAAGYAPRLRIWNVTDGTLVAEVNGVTGGLIYTRLSIRWTPAAAKTYRIELRGNLDTPANGSIFYFDAVSTYPLGEGPSSALVSTSAGSTWSVIETNAVLLHRTTFNQHELVGEAEDAASQAAFANFVPGGVLWGGLSDEALITQDMVDKKAAALVAGRKAIKQRVQYVVALRPSLTTGSPVTLAPDNQLPLGTSGDLDVLEVTHEAIPGGKTTLVLNDHAPTATLAQDSALAYATGRSI